MQNNLQISTTNHRPRKSLRLFAFALFALLLSACSANIHNTPSSYTKIAKPARTTQSIELDESDEADASKGALTAEQEKALGAESEIKFDLDQRETDEFIKYFKLYTARDENGQPMRGREAFEKWLNNARPYLPYIRQIIKDRGLPEDLIFLPFAESGFNNWVTSRAGAVGMWQFMPYTARKQGLKVDWWIDERRDPYKATVAAMDYLTRLYEMFGDWYLALAAYNAGEGKISRVIQKTGTNDYFEMCKAGDALKAETRHYVPKILAICKIVRNLETLGFEPIDWSADPGLIEVKVKGGTDLMALAKTCNLSWEDFEELNPAFRRTVSPPEHDSSIWLPEIKVAYAKAYLGKPESRPFAGYKKYEVQNGDSWWGISRRNQVPIPVLRKINSEIAGSTLQPGQEIMIPAQSRNEAIVAAPSGTKTAKAEAKVAAAESKAEKTRTLAAKRSNYTVKSGDSVWNIARKFEVPVETLLASNGMKSGRELRTGQKLYIPAAGEAETRVAHSKAKNALKIITHRVQEGDTIWNIARRYNVDPASVLNRNKLDRNAVLRPGQEILIGED